MKKFLIGLAVVLVLLIVAANFFLGDIVKGIVNKGGSAALGVPVKLEKAEFRLLRGHITLKGFELGNPEGFNTSKAISVGEVTVELDPKSLLSDTIVIKRIYVDAPEVNYELGLGKSNIGKILDGMSKKADDGGQKTEETPKSEGGKKVVIEDFLIENGRVLIAAKLTGGFGAPIPLPAIHMTDIGKDEGGASVVDVIGKIFGAIFSAVGSVATGAVGLVGDGAMAAGGLAVDGAEAVGGAAVDGVKAVGNVAGKALNGIGGLLGGDADAK